MLFSEIDLVTEEIAGSASWNMAVDEALARCLDRPVLRVYQWRRPAVSFGYFEKVSDIRHQYPAHEWVRRWTGGGSVEHGADWTYALIVPASHSLARARPAESYQRIHTVVGDFLRKRGLEVELANQGTEQGFGCFQRPVTADVLWNGIKVAGAAQRRTRDFLLHQGSVQQVILDEWKPLDWASAFSASVHSRQLRPDEVQIAEALEAARYGARAWLERR